MSSLKNNLSLASPNKNSEQLFLILWTGQIRLRNFLVQQQNDERIIIEFTNV